jgi:hypothetical protein
VIWASISDVRHPVIIRTHSSPQPRRILGLPTSQGRDSQGGAHGSDSLEEVLLAVDTPRPGETPVGQLHLAVCTLEAGAVPVSVQDLQDELVQDVLVAASTLGYLCGERRERGSVRLSHSPADHTTPFPGGCLPMLPVLGTDRTQPLQLPHFHSCVEAVLETSVPRVNPA